MKPTYLTSICLPVMLAFASCSKDKKALPTTVEGHIYNGTGEVSWEGPVEVVLVKEVFGGGLSSGEEQVQTTYSDENGYYRMDFKAEDTRYWVRMCARNIPLHHNYCRSVEGNAVERGVKQTIDLYLPPYAWLELHVENVNYQPGDLLSVNLGNGVSPNFYGPADDTIIFRGGGGNKVLYYNLLRNEKWENFVDTIYLFPFDTTYYKIEY